MVWPPNLEPSQEERHRYFLREAYKVAWRLSDDPMSKVGAYLVKLEDDGYRAVAYGANHIPHSAGDFSPEELVELLMDRDWKMANVIHAERAAILMAKEHGYATQGLTMYMPWVPCGECGDLMRETGIAALVSHHDFVLRTPERWWESTSVSVEKLQAAGIRCFAYKGKIEGALSVFNGEVWRP